MTELKDLKKGDKVTLLVEAEVLGLGEDSVDVVYSSETQDWFTVYAADIKDGSVTIQGVEKPLLTEPGVYVPGNNASIAHYSYLYRLGEEEDWSRISDGEEEDITHSAARKAHETLGGLVRLVPEQ